jgi:hypothetical protein
MRSPVMKNGSRYATAHTGLVHQAAACKQYSTGTDTVCVCRFEGVWTAGVSVQVLADQPLTASRRRQLLLNFLQAKLEAEDEQLVLEGARVRMACAGNRLLF